MPGSQGEGNQGAGGTPAPQGQQGGTPAPQGQQGGTPGQQGGDATFETWLGQQDEATRGLIDGHVQGLRTALQSERQQRRDFERDLREAAQQLEAGSDARQQLERMANEQAAAESRAEFYERAHAAGVTNLRLAWAAVQADEGLMDRRGNVNLEQLREGYPELFGRPAAPPGNAGSGTQAPPASGTGMDDFIRARAGVRVG